MSRFKRTIYEAERSNEKMVQEVIGNNLHEKKISQARKRMELQVDENLL
jgi:hypothetical protein